MKTTTQHTRRFDLGSSEGQALPGLLGMHGQLVIVSFRGARVRVLASHNPGGQQARVSVAAEPVTDPYHLELLSGADDASSWPRPVFLHAVIEPRLDPVLAVQRASRWASYAARVAVAPEGRLNDRAVLEAQLRGVWIAASSPSQLRIVAAGEQGPAAGSVRGLAHRLLDELIWAALPRGTGDAAIAAKSAATS